MRDIPVFSTENGIASLIFREIPYRGEAYITLQDTKEPEKFLKECVDFCKAVGADKIFATGHEFLNKFPIFSVIYQMEIPKADIKCSEAKLIQVSSNTIDQWRDLHNKRMIAVPNAATITLTDANELMKSGSAYYIQLGKETIGLGVAEGDTVKSVISLKHGYGHDVVCALSNALDAEIIKLEVASTNTRAVDLYKRLGFIETKECKRWFLV